MTPLMFPSFRGLSTIHWMRSVQGAATRLRSIAIVAPPLNRPRADQR